MPVAWFSPTYRSLSDAWRNLDQTLSGITARKSAAEHRLELIGGGVLEAWSLENPDSGRGRAYAAIVVDEAAMVAGLQHAWQQSIRPMLTDYRGSAWFLSTPKGIASYFHTLFQFGQDPEKSDWASWQRPTIENPVIDPREIEDARGDLSELAFSQEYLAQFVSWEGAVFRHILDAIYTGKPEGQCVSIGVDWGKVNDYTVFTALSDLGYLLEVERSRGVEYTLQRKRLQAFWERHGKPRIHAESNAMGGPVIEQLNLDGLKVKPFNTTNASKAEAVESLALAFERDEIKIPNDPMLIGELQAFEAIKLPSGLMRYAAPEGTHDDIVISLAIGWQGIGNHRKKLSNWGQTAAAAASNVALTRPSSFRMGGPNTGAGLSPKWNQG